MNLATLLVLLLVVLLAVLALRAMRRGKSDACGSPCSGCSCRDLCEKRKD